MQKKTNLGQKKFSNKHCTEENTEVLIEKKQALLDYRKNPLQSSKDHLKFVKAESNRYLEPV